jgi:hypothetical protein
MRSDASSNRLNHGLLESEVVMFSVRGTCATVIAILLYATVHTIVAGQAPPGIQSVGGAGKPFFVPAAAAMYPLDSAFLRWPLAEADRQYGAIDGRHLHTFVVEQAAISQRFRDAGHPQFWGRIIGSKSDAESAEWLAQKFRSIGLADARIQSLPIAAPVWEPVQPWEIVARNGDERLPLTSAQPVYESVGAPAGGIDLEAVYVGTGSEADFQGRDVRGKAVVVYSVPFPAATWETARSENVYQRAEEKGAAAILVILALPGNLRVQGYTTRGKIPTFMLGMEDGYALREMLGRGGRDTPHIKINFQTKMVPGLTSATVWGRLPGATAETVYVMAHRDGWFDGAGDNASGVATMLGLAEYFAKVPLAQRRRTIVFIGVSGHHGPAVSSQDLLARRVELFAKTALLINAEHTSTLQTYLYWNAIRPANTFSAQLWYAGGPSRPKLQDIAIRALQAFGVTTYASPERGAPPGDLLPLWRLVPAVTTTDFNYMYFHTNGETPETVPWTGLEATTRAYAKIIDETNKLELSELQRPEETAGR